MWLTIGSSLLMACVLLVGLAWVLSGGPERF